MGKQQPQAGGNANNASYELLLARSLLEILAERCEGDSTLENALYSVADHVSRAKELIDA